MARPIISTGDGQRDEAVVRNQSRGEVDMLINSGRPIAHQSDCARSASPKMFPRSKIPP
jgi:hypothetical protein